MASAVPLTRDDLRLLAECGFVAAQCEYFTAARTIFESLKVLRPDSTLPFIGLAMAEVSAKRADVAARILRDEGLVIFPGDLELMAFLGMALHEAGRRSEAFAVLQKVVDQGESIQPHVKMAKKLLGSERESLAPGQAMPGWGMRC